MIRLYAIIAIGTMDFNIIIVQNIIPRPLVVGKDFWDDYAELFENFDSAIYYSIATGQVN